MLCYAVMDVMRMGRPTGDLLDCILGEEQTPEIPEICAWGSCSLRKCSTLSIFESSFSFNFTRLMTGLGRMQRQAMGALLNL